MNTDQIVVTTQARRIARFTNEHAEVGGWVGHFDPQGRFLSWVCGPGGGARLTPDAIEAGYVLVRVSHGRDFTRDVQQQINSQREVA